MPETFTEEDFADTTPGSVTFSESDFAEPVRFSEADFTPEQAPTAETPSLQPVLNVSVPREQIGGLAGTSLVREPFPRLPQATQVTPINLFGGETDSLLGFIPQIPQLSEAQATALGSLPGLGGLTIGPAGAKIAAGAGNAAIGMAKGVATPMGLASFGAGPMANAIRPLFAAEMGLGAARAVPGTIEALQQGNIQQAAETGIGGIASGLLARHLMETPLDRILRDAQASPVPITATTVATMREAAIAEAPGAMVPIESIPQARTTTTEVPSAIQEQGANAGVLRPTQSEVGLSQVGTRNAQSEVTPGTQGQAQAPQAEAGAPVAEVVPEATAPPSAVEPPPPATARAPIYPEEQGPTQLGIRPGGGSIGSAINDLFTGFKDKANAAVENVRGTISTLAGKSLPRTTRLNTEAGEAGVRYGSSNVAAPYVAEDFARRVIGETDVDPRKFGAALTEDNLRSVRQNFADEGKTSEAASVRSFIGAKGSPFKTEAEYQAFLNEPATKAAIERHKQLWADEVDPIYRKAADLDPDLELPSRGLQTGARINLFADRVGLDVTPRDAVTFGMGTGSRLTGTFRRKTPFATRATGAAETYFTNYDDMMANTFAKQMEIANKRIFDDKLVNGGLAVIDKPGKTVEFHGKPAMAFPVRRGPNSLNIYVDPRIANEYRIVSNTYTPWLSTGASKKIAGTINGMQLAGLVDPVVHISNLGTVLLTRPNVAGGNIFMDSLLSATGRADVPVRLISATVRSLRETLAGTKDNPGQLRELAEIGALRGKHRGLNPGSRLIGWVDQSVRVAMDRTYQRLADDGLLKKSETARREFVNQAGQYNKRLQDFVTIFLRSSNLGPFATAGKNFMALGWRNSPFGGFGHGSVATSAASGLALRANVLSKLIGSSVLVGTINYLINGKVAGRPGTPIGRIDTGKSDENGRPLTLPAFDLLGFGRSLRVTGLRGALDAKRLGLDNPTALDAAYRDMFNAIIAPAMGPVPRTALSVGNIPSGINVPKPNPVVFPGESQLVSNLANTGYAANTVVAGLRESGALGRLAPWLPYVNQLPPKPTLEVLSKQLPRLVPTPGKPAEMTAKYPEIVMKAKTREVLEDVIRRARQMEPGFRRNYVNQSVNKMPVGEREMARRELIRRRVMPR